MIFDRTKMSNIVIMKMYLLLYNLIIIIFSIKTGKIFEKLFRMAKNKLKRLKYFKKCLVK